MEVHPVRTEPLRTWVVVDGINEFAVCEFEDGRIVCISHDHECRHAVAARRRDILRRLSQEAQELGIYY